MKGVNYADYITALGWVLARGGIISKKTRRLLKRLIRLVNQTRTEVGEIKTMTQQLTGDVEGLKNAVTANLAEQAETLALQQTTITKLGELAQTIIDNAADQTAVAAAAEEIRSLTGPLADSTASLDSSNTALAAAVGVEPAPVPETPAEG